MLGAARAGRRQGWPTGSHLTACQRPFVLPPAEETGLPAEEAAGRDRAASSPPDQGIKTTGRRRRRSRWAGRRAQTALREL